MTFPKMNNITGDLLDVTAVCNNCGTTWTANELRDIANPEQRIEAGCEVPAGECPDEACGALCYLVKKSKEPVETPPALLPGYEANFETLKKAAANDDLLLISAIRKADRQPVALVAALSNDGKELSIVPFAVMVEGNPYDLFEDPTA